MKCKHCHGPAYHMGTLGGLAWFRCRNCGAEHSVKDSHCENPANDGERCADYRKAFYVPGDDDTAAEKRLCDECYLAWMEDVFPDISLEWS